MQQIQTHFRWFRSFRVLRISASLLALLVVFAIANASFILLAQKPQNVKAQDIPVVAQPKTEEIKETPASEPVQTETTSSPSPTPTPAPAQPAVAPAPAPAYDKVSIPSLGMSARYVTVGLTSTNAIDVHPSLVGWWNGSAQPGTPGTVFLDGHNPGVFSKLPNIQNGAQISISKANGEVFNYTVVHNETVQLADINMRAALSAYGGASEGLNLMTCVGAYNARTGTTDQRLVVYAVRS